MLFLIYIICGLVLLYGILFQYYLRSWKQLPVFEASNKKEDQATCFISVVIPARNEAANIAACLQSICKQDYPYNLFEIIVVDDASSDDTVSIARSIQYKGVQIKIEQLDFLTNNTAPKKRAIEKGIAHSQGKLIVTTDADCIAGPGWLKNIAAWYLHSKNVFIAAPVVMQNNSSLLSRFQSLDFLTMQGITAASVSQQFHFMCNGANLAYEKKVFGEVDGFSGIDQIASGDDMLLMNKIARLYPKQIGFVKSPAAIVSTGCAESWGAFLQQRIRWASKTGHYKQPKMLMVLLLVYLLNLLLLGLLVFACWNPIALLYFVGFCLIKFLLEVPFVKPVANFFGQIKLLPWLLILQPLHIAYIVVSGFLGQVKTYEWKGRKLK
jgi:cellulose synthase/poly-beta-1,6-N-acetylglucosamine synthase-like glycosyltransferase